MMPETIAEGRVILIKFWHKFQATKDDLCQKDEGVFIKAGENCNEIVIMLFFGIQNIC